MTAERLGDAVPRVRVDGRRLLSGIETLALIGADPLGGITRLGFSHEEDEARSWLMDRAKHASLDACVDAAGNVIIRRKAAHSGKAALVMASHMDTVRQGGALDGAYGVLAALEVLTVLEEQDVDLPLEPVAIAFANEEGGLFPYPFFGSRAVAGSLDPGDVFTTSDGLGLREPLRRAGGDLARIEHAAWPDGAIGAYLELHIEQGPVLESNGLPIGVVEGITGRTIFEVEVSGRSGHAGTTSMDMRADALVAASHAVLAVEALTARGLCRVATVSRLQAAPDQVNVVPGTVGLTGEFRDMSAARLQATEKELTRDLAAIAHMQGVRIDCRIVDRVQPVATDPALQAAITGAVRGLGLPSMSLESGAGHDAQIIAARAPIGMIFVPSREGVSHAPEEHTDDAALVAGADALLTTAVSLPADPASTRTSFQGA